MEGGDRLEFLISIWSRSSRLETKKKKKKNQLVFHNGDRGIFWKIRSTPMASYPILSLEKRNHAKACPGREKERKAGGPPNRVRWSARHLAFWSRITVKQRNIERARGQNTILNI